MKSSIIEMIWFLLISKMKIKKQTQAPFICLDTLMARYTDISDPSIHLNTPKTTDEGFFKWCAENVHIRNKPHCWSENGYAQYHIATITYPSNGICVVFSICVATMVNYYASFM